MKSTDSAQKEVSRRKMRRTWLPNGTILSLFSSPRTRKHERARSKVAAQGCDNLFVSPAGKPISVNTIKLVFSRLAKTSGVERLHTHLCRHTFAINYLLNGGDMFSLREILGHSSLDMVNHYLHFTSSQIIDQHRKYSPMDRLQGIAR